MSVPQPFPEVGGADLTSVSRLKKLRLGEVGGFQISQLLRGNLETDSGAP